ncbi:MAG: hypothetical protein WBZ36_31510 [Candidatus Nitrosopolaris sp.]
MRKRIGLAAIAVIVVVVAILFRFGGVKLTDFNTQLAVGLSLMVPVILYFMFKPEIESRLRPSHLKKMVEQTQPQPDTLEGDVIRHYATRDELKFHHMLSIAHDSVEMLALTFTIVTEQYYDELNYALSKGISLTFLLLDPNSKETRRQRGLYHRSDDLKYQIRNSLKVLCSLKRKFPDKIIIKLYDARALRGITVIDRKNSDNAWIRVERRELDSVPNSRPSDAWFRREEEDRFDSVAWITQMQHRNC